MVSRKQIHFGIAAVFAAILISVTSCNKEEEQDYNRDALLTNLVDNLILPHYDNFYNELSELEVAVENFNGASSAANLNTMRTAFLDAYLAFQNIKMYDFGPASDYAFKSACNTYPTDTAKINANISSGSYILGAAENTTAIGFPSLDFLLYHGSDLDVINRFTTDDNAANARTYILEVTQKMKTELGAIIATWNSSYRTSFVAANGTDVGSSLSLLYNEWVKDIELLKNAKIAIPAGLFSGGEQFPHYVEAYYSGHSKLLALESLNALEQVFLGNVGEGMDDNMDFEVENGTASLTAVEVSDQFGVIRIKIEGLGDPFSAAIPADFSGFNDTFQEIKKLVAYAKTDMPAILGVLVTFSDTDGD